MVIKDFLFPFKNNSLDPLKSHSISEVVFTIYLGQAILKPERFKQLIEQDKPLSQYFQEFKLSVTKGVEFKIEKGEHKINTQDQISGFSFRKFSEGKPVWIINCNNNPNPVLSIHNLAYTRWEDFSSHIKELLKILSTFYNGFFLRGFGLNYIDQFNWIGSEKIDFSRIFNIPNKYLPEIITASLNSWEYNFNQRFIKETNENTRFFQSIRLFSKNIVEGNINIGIIHNIVREFESTESLEELLISDTFIRELNILHDSNKEILKTLLQKDIQDLINLK